ncbi:MAG: alpha/beta hydrolase [Lachnospiraceae bacterium]|nr:alpha/beta hydrolase [Lachnospiraceae bacterium]
MLKVILIILLILLIAVLGISYFCMYYVLTPKVRSMEDGAKLEKEHDNWGDWDSYEKEEWDVTSFDGYLLHGTLIYNRGEHADPDKFCIITHGYTSNRYGSFRYIPTFYDLGYNIYIYDDRHHGANKRCFTTMGYWEKKDLIEVKNALQKRFGSHIKIGIHGESLGCAISLSALGLTQDFKFCIADCGYADLQMLLTELIGDQMHLPKFFASLASVWCKIVHGFYFSDVKPCMALKDNTTPILFIHGDADTFIDKKHSEINYKHAQNCYKEIHFFPGADHAWSCMSDKAGYDKLVKEFVGKLNI